MMIDRRAFVAGSALVAVAPACGLLPLNAAADVTDERSPVLMIDGWERAGRRRSWQPGLDQSWSRMAHSLAMIARTSIAKFDQCRRKSR